MFRMLIHPSLGTCDLFVELFHGLYCYGSMRVGVTLWFGWGGVVSGCRLKQCFSGSAYTRIPHRQQTIPVHNISTPQVSLHNTTQHKYSLAPEDGRINV